MSTLYPCMLIKVRTNAQACTRSHRHLHELASLLDLCFSLDFTHTIQPVPAHTNTHTHSLTRTKTPVSLLQCSEWFRSQLSHITGEEGVRPSIKELFKWNHVLWWFKANISLAHSYWMCSSEEQAFKWARTLLLRFERRLVGATCRGGL